MLRRRPAPTRAVPRDDDEPPQKKHHSSKKCKTFDSRVDVRALVSTLFSAVSAAVNPSPGVRSQAYSEYLTSQVYKLTIGWHIFRTVTEGAFLAAYGLAFDTIVVQVFWSISVGSVLLYGFRHRTWLLCREWLCVCTNLCYGLVTVLKIFNMVPRLPNENHYMFKHCFLTMADAAFSQTAVHRQYVVQFVEAVIRVIVWRRYNVLANTPTWGIVCVSLAWQLWLVTFSSMLQARHVSAFTRQRAAAAAAGSSSNTVTSSGASSSAAAAAAPAVVAGPAAINADGGSAAASRPASCELEPANLRAAAAGPAVASSAAAAAGPATDAPGVERIRRSFESCRNGGGGVATGGAGAAPEGTGARGMSGTADLLPLSGASNLSGTNAQKRFMRALRSVTRGPSSYVLLAHQRRQAGGSQCATAQFYIPSANPDMLSGSWRERLAVAISEGAPGWQVANVCTRKGSLIVHLDLVYVPARPTGASAGAEQDDGAMAGAGPAGATAAALGCGGGAGFSAVSYSEKPFEVTSGCDPKAALDDFMGGMSAESLLELLGLPLDVEGSGAEPAPISVQLADRIRNLPSASQSAAEEKPVLAATTPSTATSSRAAAATSSISLVTDTTSDTQNEVEEGSAVPLPPAAAETALETATRTAAEMSPPPPVLLMPVTAAAAAVGATSGSAPSFDAWQRLVVQPVLTALRPPPELRSREYGAFLSWRVGGVHVAYASIICLTSAVLFLVRSLSEVNPLTLMLFISAEVLSVVSLVALGGPAWRTVRCGLVFLGVALRTLQMAACTSGFMPHVLSDSDCASGRWIQKVALITTLQALCMQPPVRAFFLVRIPSVLLSVYVHVYVCQLGATLPSAIILHVGWELGLFLISANLQFRHLEAFRSQQNQSDRAGCDAKGGPETERPHVQTEHCCGQEDAASGAAKEEKAAAGRGPTATDTPAESSQPIGSGTPTDDGDVAVADAVTEAAAAGPAAFLSAAVPGDPTDVSLSAPLVEMAPRRAARLQLHFTCAPAIVDELQVVLRHINPASMATGVHVAHSVRDIAHALGTPAGAASAPPHTPAPFSAELTLVASPADMPGLVHVELWRGRRRVCSQPALLAAPPPTSALVSAACGASGAYGGAGPTSDLCAEAECGGDSCTAASTSTWLNDVRSYVGGLRQQGHGAAAEQFLEELGGWLAAAAALERGLADSAAAAGGAGGPARVANVLYFHGFGSEFMYVKPRHVSGAGGGGSGAAAASDSSPSPLRQLLLCQGAMLLAVSVEAGCLALSEHLLGLMVAQMGATLGALLEATRTPVTQLPLLHAAVKSGDARMVDLVAEWSVSAGLKSIWTQEAAVLVASLEACGDSALGDTASLEGRLGGDSGLQARRNSRSLRVSQDRRPGCFRDLDPHAGGSMSLGLVSGGHNVIPLPATREPAIASVEPQRQQAGGGTGAAVMCAVAVPALTGACTDAALSSADVISTDVDAGMDFDLDAALYDSGDDLADDSPFKIIDFRASNRPAPSGACAEAAPGVGGSGDSSKRTARSSLDGLVNDGVLVLTPLHISLALGDEGRLASHIIRTYPEAYEVWRSSQLHLDLEPSASSASAAFAGDGSARVTEGYFLIHPYSHVSAADPDTLSPPPPPLPSSVVQSSSLCASHSNGGTFGALAAAAGCSSLPGLTTRRKVESSHIRGGSPGGGSGGLAAEDSMDCSSMRSMSLSEVALFEGLRWVNEDAPKRRPAFKVTRM